MVNQMVMAVFRKDGTNFFNFHVERKDFSVGDRVQDDRLDGVHIVVHKDPATVAVKPL